MPRRDDLATICVLGSGPVVIGQAAEFDYAGTQAIKALKEEGYRVVLINSNPASIMTNPGLAHQSYIEPLTLPYVVRILEKERPCAILPTVGGQTALNLALELSRSQILTKLGIELIGADIEAIERAEDRELFKQVMTKAGLPTLRSSICHNLDDAKVALEFFGLPIVLRPSFTLGGTGGGIAHSQDEFFELASMGLRLSPTHQILVEESVIGHQEFEFEVIRDGADNAIVVCAIENFDPMGVHTGDSITVAPIQTLSDAEYQILRDASLKVVRAIGVRTGGCNVQFSFNPLTGQYFVIEMNPRVSRSSALASKATGYPIAKVAAKLAVGYRLDELCNDITKKTAAFEPALDYVVTKIPVFAFEKFLGQEPELTTQMRSVGEVMAIGRSFQESLSKALASLELGAVPQLEGRLLSKATPHRLLRIMAAMREGMSVKEVATLTNIHPWFLAQIGEIIALEKQSAGLRLEALDIEHWRTLKMAGLSDASLAVIFNVSEKNLAKARLKIGVRPIFRRVDTCAGEFLARTPYLYSSYEQPYFKLEQGSLVEQSACEAYVSQRKKIIVLGSGPIRIGQGIEFDCCTTEAVMAIKDLGLETIMINSNPETVSTDFDTADRLYFEPLTLEHVLNIVALEEPLGVIVQLGGQTPLSLARGLESAGVKILGTSFDNIDRAEDRMRSRELFAQSGLRQPPSMSVYSLAEAVAAALKLGYPVMVRPSYVLGGRAMQRCHNERELIACMAMALRVAPDTPVLIDRFLDGAIEVDVDALCDGNSVYVAGILQHIEEAGIHSGDSYGVLPPYDLSSAMLAEIEEATQKLARELNIVGFLNIQFAVRQDILFVLEANPRASRTVPFLSKATGVPLASLAAQIICGAALPELLANHNFTRFMPPRTIAVKAPVMPFAKFPNFDPLLGPEMRSTGEVMATADCFEWALVKSQLAAGIRLPSSGGLFVSLADRDKEHLLDALNHMNKAGFTIYATCGTHWFLAAHHIPSLRVQKVREGSPHAVDLLEQGHIGIMFNTILGSSSVHDSHLFRKKSLALNIPYFTSVSAIKAVAKAIALKPDDRLMALSSLQELHQHSFFSQLHL